MVVRPLLLSWPGGWWFRLVREADALSRRVQLEQTGPAKAWTRDWGGESKEGFLSLGFTGRGGRGYPDTSGCHTNHRWQ